MDISANAIITKLNSKLSEMTLQNVIMEIQIEGLQERIRSLEQFAEQKEE